MVANTEKTPFDPAEDSLISTELKKHEVGMTASAIEAAFAPMVVMLRDFESQYEVITAKPINADTIKEAKELRLKMVKVRTGTKKIHEEQKAYFLRGGRAIDAVKNILEFAVVGKEKSLADIENHFINIENERKRQLFDDRVSRLIPFISEMEAKMIPLGEMGEDAFENLCNGYRLAYEAKIAAEKEAEVARLKEAEAKAAEDLRIRQENEVLRKAQQERELEFQKERDRLEAIRKEENAVREKERLKQEEKLKKERAERKRLEDEAAAKLEQEELERKQKAADERKLKRAPDKIKLLTLAEQIELLPLPDLKEQDAKDVLVNVQGLLGKTIKYLKDNTEKL